ncbi:MAG: tetratricopeptide repeat protein [Phormidesmis sp.]
MLIGPAPSASAQQLSPQARQQFLADPLTEMPRDPLLPDIPLDRPLSPLEQSQLEADLMVLDETAQQLLTSGFADEAFGLWQRELRLRRVFGPAEEFKAIQRVAEIAWNAQRPIEVQLLTLRTRNIWETVRAALGLEPEELAFAEEPEDALQPARMLVRGNTASDVAVLDALAQTFVMLRDIDSSVEVYQQLIELSDRQNIDTTRQATDLAALHLSWFQFAEAADVYLALLAEAKTNNNLQQQATYLKGLIYSYQQADALLNATRAQTELLEIYQIQGDGEKLPELMLAIAQNYRALNRPQNAITYYRAAYSAAQRFNQFSFSAQVLKDLGDLYSVLALNDQALGAYELLVPVEQQAYNTYGIMEAYDNIGKLQKRLGNSAEAIQAFQQGLVAANQLGIREAYFIEQIEAISQR